MKTKLILAMDRHFNLTDNEFESQFANCILDPTIFNHEAHLRLAWIYIKKYGLEKAEEKYQNQLKKFVAHVGAKDKYHTTLTIMAMRAVNHCIHNSNTLDFKGFIMEFPQLKTDFKALINSHYSYDIFTCAIARKSFVKPDSLPFE